MTDSGHEMGTIRIEQLPESSLPKSFDRTVLQPDGFTVAGIKIATASEGGVESDCAVALASDDGREFIVSTAPPPGAVVLIQPGQPCDRTEFLTSSFVWRFAR